MSATIESFLTALETCAVVVDGRVQTEMMAGIHHLTSFRIPLTFPPGVRLQNFSAVQGAHARRIDRTARELERYAKNRLNELEMKASRKVPALHPMTQSPPFTIAAVAPTFAELKALL